MIRDLVEHNQINHIEFCEEFKSFTREFSAVYRGDSCEQCPHIAYTEDLTLANYFAYESSEFYGTKAYVHTRLNVLGISIPEIASEYRSQLNDLWDIITKEKEVIILK